MPEGNTTAGSRVVLFVFAMVVVITGGLGAIIGATRPADLDPELFGLIQLPPTPLGVALFGMVTIGTGLGVFVAAVVYVSRRYDTTTPE